MQQPRHAGEPGDTGCEGDALAIDVSGLNRTIISSLRLFAEAVVVPTLLLAALLHVVGIRAALSSAIGWCLLAILVRWISQHRVPGTLVVCTAMLTGKVALTLASSTLLVYLLQPVLGSAVMAVLFLGSAVLGRPITVRLARDFVHVPAHVLSRRAVRRMFTQIALLWGLSRLGDAGMSLGFLHLGLHAGLLSRAVLSPILTLLTIAVCALWGWRVLRRDGVRIRFALVAPA